MTNIRVRVVAAWALSILLFLTYMTVAPPKLLGDPGWLQRFAEWGYSPRFAGGIGMVELIAAALLLAFVSGMLVGRPGEVRPEGGTIVANDAAPQRILLIAVGEH